MAKDWKINAKILLNIEIFRPISLSLNDQWALHHINLKESLNTKNGAELCQTRLKFKLAELF